MESIKQKETVLSNIILYSVLLLVVIYFAWLQFVSPAMFDPDCYYHAAVSKFLSTYGPHYKFHWAQFSTFNNSFSDSDFLFHILIIPFLFITKNAVLAAKYAIIFYNILFLLLFTYILKKYLSNLLVAFVVLLIVSSSYFTYYFLLLRTLTMVNILTMLSIYFLINKNWIKLAILCVLYPLTHLSFYTVIIFGIICEALRLFTQKDIFLKNLYIPFLGCAIGCLIHPNFPNNFVHIYLNSFLVPLFSVMGVDLSFGIEVFSSPARYIFLNNFIVFCMLGFVLWTALLEKNKISLSTFVWLGCSTFYLRLSFHSDRFWYTTTILIFIFFAAYLKDWLLNANSKQANKKLASLSVCSAFAMLMFFPSSHAIIKEGLTEYMLIGSHYEKVALWMRQNIPAGETIYHASWSDSPYFIYLNSKNDYIVCCDPIYMFYHSSQNYLLYDDLKNGRIEKPYEVIAKDFKAHYGYAGKKSILYSQIQKDHEHYKILYEDDKGVVFQIPS